MEYDDDKRDYSNLKIESLKIEEDAPPAEEDEEVNEDGEKVKKSKDGGGTWSKLVSGSDSIDSPSEPEKPGKNTALFHFVQRNL